MDILERFFKYISVDTTSNSEKFKNPTSSGQRSLAKILVDDLAVINLDSLYFDEENCYVYGVLRGDSNLPSIGFVSHMDTSEDACGRNIKPNVITDYDGEDVVLSNGVVLSANDYPDLKKHVGKTLITTDGRTLLGADDKAGIVEIISAFEYFSKSNVSHGDLYFCFCPDEEIGLGTQNFDIKYFNPDYAYTVDGSSVGMLSYENFNAATANISVSGVSTHTGVAKNKMINAIRVANIICGLIPDEIPENTDGYEGFYHLNNMSGDVSNATIKYLIRDFDLEGLARRKEKVAQIVDDINSQYHDCVRLDLVDTYHNMRDIVMNNPNFIEITKNAINRVGVTPVIEPVRGGTDGTDISELGIPCPNLGTGGHNFHSVYEYICLEDMEKTVEILISIVNQFVKNKDKLIKK